MKKALTFDYDGVIADTNQVKSDWIAENLGQEVPPWKCDRTQCVPLIGLQEYERMSQVVYDRTASMAAKPMVGAIEAIRALAKGFRLFIVTARTPEGIQWTKEWLAREGVEGAFAGILSSKGSTKPEIVQQLEAIALVDDDVRHLQGGDAHRFARILFAPDRGQVQVESEIVLVQDWTELLAVLRDLDQTGRK